LNIINNPNNLKRCDRDKGKVVEYFPAIEDEINHPEPNNIIQSAIKQHEIDWTRWKTTAKDNKHYRTNQRGRISVISAYNTVSSMGKVSGGFQIGDTTDSYLFLFSFVCLFMSH
jgi:hypothetical protein